jgi:hypothetical protein
MGACGSVCVFSCDMMGMVGHLGGVFSVCTLLGAEVAGTLGGAIVGSSVFGTLGGSMFCTGTLVGITGVMMTRGVLV